jgi:chorismate-pyruvate lyase
VESKQFDPFAGIFIAQDKRPPQLEDIALESLSPFERTLLVIDGTVTRFLEAHTLEPIEIVDSGRTKETLKKDHAWLECSKGETVVSRRVLLQGRNTKRTYASAASLVVPERVKEAVGHPVDRVPEGLGRMLLNSRVEQYRELLWYGKEPPSDLPGEMRSLASEYCLARTYRIIVKGKPTMMITEWFEFGTAG